jgi:hypothetical protein
MARSGEVGKVDTKLFLLGLLACILLLPSPAAASFDWWDETYLKGRNITVTNPTAWPLVNYPIFVNVSNTSITSPADVRIVNAACGLGGSEIEYDMINYTASWFNVVFFMNVTNGSSSIYCAYYGSTYPSNTSYPTMNSINLTNGSTLSIRNNFINVTIQDRAGSVSGVYNGSNNWVTESNANRWFSIGNYTHTIFGANVYDANCEPYFNGTIYKSILCQYHNDTTQNVEYRIFKYGMYAQVVVDIKTNYSAYNIYISPDGQVVPAEVSFQTQFNTGVIPATWNKLPTNEGWETFFKTTSPAAYAYMLWNESNSSKGFTMISADANGAASILGALSVSNSTDTRVFVGIQKFYIGFGTRNASEYYNTFYKLPGPVVSNESNVTARVYSCAQGIAAMNFTFKDEQNLSSVKGDFKITIYIWPTSNASDYRNYSFSNTDVYSIGLCTYPENESYTINATIEYGGDAYATRYYFIINTNIGVNNIILYQLVTASATQISMTVVDVYNTGITDVIIKAQRYYTDLNQYYTVTMAKTDYDGLAGASLEQNQWYRFIIEKNGIILRQFDPKYLTETTIVLKQSASQLIEYFSYYNDVASSCSLNNVTGTLTCTVDDDSGQMVYATLNVKRKTTLGWEQNCSQSITGSGTLVCNLGNLTGQVFTYSLIGKFGSDSTLTILQGEMIEGPRTFWLNTDNGRILGVLITFMFFITLAFIGIWNPGVTLIMGLLGLIVSYMFGVLDISYGALMALVVGVAFLVHRMRS